MATLLLLTNDMHAAAEILPALELLPYQVKVAQAEATALLDAPAADVILLDARRDLVGARSLCRLMETTGKESPLLVIVSGRLDIPWDAPVFEDRGARVLIFSTSDAEPPETVAEVRVVRHEGSVDLAKALAYLRTERGVRAVLCEGGPRLHAQLIDAGLVDELFVTHAPKLVGGDGPGLAVGLPELERPLEVVWLLEQDGELFARYRVPRD